MLLSCDNQKVHYICKSHVHREFISIGNDRMNTSVNRCADSLANLGGSVRHNEPGKNN